MDKQRTVTPIHAQLSERFTLLITAQARSYDRFIDSGFKVSAVLTIVLGWLTSSKDAQLFLKHLPSGVWGVFLVMLLGCAFLLWLNLYRARRISESLHGRIASLAYVEEEFFAHYLISARVYWAITALNGTLCALITCSFLYLRFGNW